jgi:hypothetical protein
MTTTRIAMWSCPRTVSTALLRSFAERPDTIGVDEPLYAHYLATSGKLHPMREEILASQQQNWSQVVEEVLLGPCERPLQFVKHMAHHLEGGVDTSFAMAPTMRNIFLIRDPREMLVSLQRDLGELERFDTGFGRQLELYQRLRKAGRCAAVVDSSELLANPEGMLKAICAAVGIDFLPCMLQWSAGNHSCYGVWAPAWYAKVLSSTGFRAHEAKTEPFPPELEALHDWASTIYKELRAERLQAS